MKQTVCAYMWSTYVIPKLTYGLEIQRLAKTDLENLEKFQRKCLRQIQGLPDKCSNSVTLGLLGILPVEHIIQKNTLNMFRNILDNPDLVEYEIVERQLIMKNLNEKSWVNDVKCIHKVLNLPSAYELLENIPSKERWKHMVNSKINSHVHSMWKDDISTKTSLKYLNPEALSVGKYHPVWNSVRCNIRDSQRAQLKCKILTGAYVLQANRAKFNQHKVDPTCKLCDKDPEDREHFISRCESLRAVRVQYSKQLKDLINISEELCIIDPGTFTQIVLDCTMPSLCHLHISYAAVPEIELWSREYLNKIHFTRLKLLKDNDSGVTKGRNLTV